MFSTYNFNSSSESEDDADYVPEVESDQEEDSSNDECEESNEPASKKVKLDELEPEKASDPVANKSPDNVWKSFLDSVLTTSYGGQNGKQNAASTSDDSSQLMNKNKVESAKTNNDNILDKKVPDNEAAMPKEGEKNEDKIVPVTDDNQSVLDKPNEPDNILDKKVPDDKTAMPKEGEISDDKIVPISDGNQSVPGKPIDPESDSKSDQNAVKKEKPVDVLITRPRTGISCILGTIANKGKKQSVLDKSLSDWKSFKEEEGIDKDLETFNKGRSGYIERQRFLQRSDIRSFENEKNIRNTLRKK